MKSLLRLSVCLLLSSVAPAEPPQDGKQVSQGSMTTEHILKSHQVLVELGPRELSSLIAELGHRRAANRNRAFKKARTLSYPTLSALLKILNRSDDPELLVVANRLETVRQTMTGVNLKAVELMKKALDGHAPSQGALASVFYHSEWGLHRNPIESARWAKASADANDPMGSYALAVAHSDKGFALAAGIEPDPQLAARLFSNCVDGLRVLAKNGDTMAQCHLGQIYEDGLGLTSNATVAAEWYTAAAKQGFARAQYLLGHLHASGKLGEPDPEQAAQWWQMAAQQGHSHAQASLGHAHTAGRGVARDYERALQLYRRSVAQHNPRAHLFLGHMYANGRGVKRSDRIAVDHYVRAAEQGDLEALKALAYMYDQGRGVPTDRRKALQWYEKAAKLDDVDSQLIVAIAYDTGVGVEPDSTNTLYWLRRADELGSAVAQHYLGNMHARGRGTKKDEARALLLWKKSAAQKHAPSYVNLGHAYAYGWGTDTNLALAVKWYRQASEEGDLTGAWALAGVYSRPGTDITDYAKAIKWYTKAADNNIAVACNALAWLYATCPDPKFHDSKKAIAYALKACEKDPASPAYVDTLAAAYARDKQFERAVAVQKEANVLLDKDKTSEMRQSEIEGFHRRLKLYEERKAFVEEAKPSD